MNTPAGLSMLITCIMFTNIDGKGWTIFKPESARSILDICSIIKATDLITDATGQVEATGEPVHIEYYRSSSEKGFTVSVDGVHIDSWSNGDIDWYSNKA